MNKRTFTAAVRRWDARAVVAALAADPTPARSSDAIGKTPLHHCAEQNAAKRGLDAAASVATARALLAAGADANAVRTIMDDGEEFLATPLWYAVAWGKNRALARVLLEHGARADDNAVAAAIWDQDARMVELLHARGGDIDRAARGETPLLRTAKAGRLALLAWLTDHGANVDFQDARGYTALHHAIRGNQTLANVGELLRCGASPAVKANDGSTPIDLARATGKPKLVALLEASLRARS